MYFILFGATTVVRTLTLLILLTIRVGLGGSSLSYAQDQFTPGTDEWLDPTFNLPFGPEFTLTSPTIVNGTVRDSQEALNQIIKKLEKLKPKPLSIPDYLPPAAGSEEVESVVTSRNSDWVRITFKNGFWIEYKTDPITIEVTTKHDIPYKWKKLYEPLVQKYVFDLGLEIGLEPSLAGHGAGQINMGYDGLSSPPGLLRNFLVDLANSTPFYKDIFAPDNKEYFNNAPGIYELPNSSSRYRMFGEIIQSTDRAAQSGGSRPYRYLAQDINGIVFNSTTTFGRQYGPAEKYQFFSIKSFRDPKSTSDSSSERVELRGIEPQRSASQYMLQMKFFSNRVIYLRNQTKAGVLLPVLKPNDKLTSPQRVTAFARQCFASGMTKDETEMLLPERHRAYFNQNYETIRSGASAASLPYPAKVVYDPEYSALSIAQKICRAIKGVIPAKLTPATSQ